MLIDRHNKSKSVKSLRNAKADLDRKAIELYLRAWNTQEMIAKENNISEGSINNIIKNSIHGKYEEDFEPYIYNIWRQLEGNETVWPTNWHGSS